MRRLLSALTATITALVLSLVGWTAASADTECKQYDPQTGICSLWVEVPGTPGEPGDSSDNGPKDTGSGAACYWDGRKQKIFKPPPGPVPCSTEYGYWSNSYNCYIQLLEPQPPAEDPLWEGHEPGDGAVYHCYQPQSDLVHIFWSADQPPNSGAGPTPREVALIAVDDMQLTAIRIGIAPEATEGSIGLVGMPVWMWASSPDGSTWGPQTASASAGGITITATARVHKVTWDMGDGTTVICTTPGTPYRPSYGMRTSPDCGHTYTTSSASEPDDKFTVTATSDWVVEWEGAGQSGTIRLNGLARQARVAVGEAQVLVQ